MNLKLILLDLHNQLIQNNNWIPGEGPPDQIEMIPAVAKAPTTQPVLEFLDFLNGSPEAQACLKNHGLEWSQSEQKVDTEDDPFAGETLGPVCRLDDPDCESCQ